MDRILLLSGLFFSMMMEGELSYTTGLLSTHLLDLSSLQIMLMAFLATLLTDWTVFFSGRYGHNFLKRRFPQMFSSKAFLSIRSVVSNPSVAFSYRYWYGLRIPSLVAMGMYYPSARKFLSFSFLSILLWTIALGLLVMNLKDLVLKFFDDFYWLLPIPVLLFLSMFFFARYNRNRIRRNP